MNLFQTQSEFDSPGGSCPTVIGVDFSPEIDWADWSRKKVGFVHMRGNGSIDWAQDAKAARFILAMFEQWEADGI